MTVVSSKEFATSQFLFTHTNKHEKSDMIFEPDEDFYQSISMEEAREKLHKVIDKLYAKK
ncbi:MAG: hypothetical protein FWD60_11365 [Candidatus Azobacteroides sp.]|nr:hypothetical protein [Candidatus Azobacteroides sp.]